MSGNKFNKLKVVPYEAAIDNIYGNKMPEYSPKQNIDPQNLSIQPEVTFLENLDFELKSILDNKFLPPDIKFNKYMEALSKYGLAKRKITKTISPPFLPSLTEETDFSFRPAPKKKFKFAEMQTQTEKYDSIDNVLDLANIRQVHQNQAEEFMRFLDENPDVKWNSATGELIHNGKTIKNSNVVDTLHDFMRKRKTFRPGAMSIARELKKYGYPQRRIINISQVKKRLNVADDDLDCRQEMFSTPASTARKNLQYTQQNWRDT